MLSNFFCMLLLLCSMNCVSSDRVFKDTNIIAMCRAKCLDEVKKVTVQSNEECVAIPDCYMCWHNCKMLKTQAEVWSNLCYSTACFPGCKIACAFYDKNEERSDAGSKRKKFNSAPLKVNVEDLGEEVLIKWNSVFASSKIVYTIKIKSKEMYQNVYMTIYPEKLIRKEHLPNPSVISVQAFSRKRLVQSEDYVYPESILSQYKFINISKKYVKLSEDSKKLIFKIILSFVLLVSFLLCILLILVLIFRSKLSQRKIKEIPCEEDKNCNNLKGIDFKSTNFQEAEHEYKENYDYSDELYDNLSPLIPKENIQVFSFVKNKRYQTYTPKAISKSNPLPENVNTKHKSKSSRSMSCSM